MGRNRNSARTTLPTSQDQQGGGRRITLSERWDSLLLSFVNILLRFATLRKMTKEQPQPQPKHTINIKKNNSNSNGNINTNKALHQKKNSVFSRLGAQNVLKRLGAPVVPIQQRLGARPNAVSKAGGMASKMAGGNKSARVGPAKGNIKFPRNNRAEKKPLTKDSLDMELDNWKSGQQGI
ncbi:hypothetical protein HDU67_001915 [Dinochytrium kinnereticum]|nr:hypothetical protein HDU67_001915 [Dinochytrium kinnereticum]